MGNFDDSFENLGLVILSQAPGIGFAKNLFTTEHKKRIVRPVRPRDDNPLGLR
jgi:hypothetical protein